MKMIQKVTISSILRSQFILLYKAILIYASELNSFTPEVGGGGEGGVVLAYRMGYVCAALG